MADVAESSTGRTEKKVLFFGKTGCGKSTLANALVTGGIERVVFPSSDGAAGCTREIKEETGRGWTVVDTVGLGEADAGTVSNVEAKAMLTKFLKRVKDEYAFIIFVHKASQRITTLDEMMWLLFTSIFDGAGEAFVVLFTAANENWYQRHQEEIPEYMRDYPILVTDIPPVHKKARMERRKAATRERSIQKLEADLESLFQSRNCRNAVPIIAGMNEAELEKKSKSIMEFLIELIKRFFAKNKWRPVAEAFSTLINVSNIVMDVMTLEH